MQTPSTLTRGNGFNRLTAGAIGLALLAVSTISLATLADQASLPLISQSSAISRPAHTSTTANIEFVEQNSFDYLTVEAADGLFLEENSWDYQPTANYASVAGIQISEDNSFDYARLLTIQQIRFSEENVWDYGVRAQVAGSASVAAAAPDFRSIEANRWDTAGQQLPPADNGATDY